MVDVTRSTTTTHLRGIAFALHVAIVTIVLFGVDRAVQAVLVPTEAQPTRLKQHDTQTHLRHNKVFFPLNDQF